MEQKTFQKALFIFRRDLRLEDNTGLIFALSQAKEVIPCFIFTEEQIEHNPYLSNPCLQFMIESLEDLEKTLLAKKKKLYLFYGKPEEIVERCFDELSIDVVVVNRDYTPYSIKRDQKIEKVCKKLDISFHSFDDALLHPPEDTVKADGKPYTVFTPFYRNASKLPVLSKVVNHHNNYYKDSISFSLDSDIYQKILPNRSYHTLGGRDNGLNILKKIKSFSSYAVERDFPAKDATTHLSSHLKFTTCSIREVYEALIDEPEIVRSLYWRDFFTTIAFYFPHVFTGSFHSKFDKLTWNDDKKAFKKWCEGNTGFPLIDAGMRELNQTGFMHNRVRMIAASFLVKDLHVDWRLGEKYFATKLVDYDPAVNNGNWQWAASTGCDAQPYFRVFNPWLQSAKFDPDCLYIKKWIPELSDYPSKDIHNWYLKNNQTSYPPPIVDHSKESKIAITKYKKI